MIIPKGWIWSLLAQRVPKTAYVSGKQSQRAHVPMIPSSLTRGPVITQAPGNTAEHSGIHSNWPVSAITVFTTKCTILPDPLTADVNWSQCVCFITSQDPRSNTSNSSKQNFLTHRNWTKFYISLCSKMLGTDDSSVSVTRPCLCGSQSMKFTLEWPQIVHSRGRSLLCKRAVATGQHVFELVREISHTVWLTISELRNNTGHINYLRP